MGALSAFKKVPLFSKISTKLIILIILLSAVPLLLVSYFFFNSYRDSLEHHITEDFELMAESQEGHLLTFLESMKGRVVDFSSDGFIRDLVQNTINNPENLTNEISITDNIFTNPAFNDILNGFQNTKDLDCKDVKVLQRPLYLNNYYYDMYGNKIEASLKDYINDYHIRINDNNNEGQKVNIIKGKSNFIIPNQFDTLKYQTNAYNIDWNRIINPMTTF